ncbi:MAG: OsmC family protein [Pseudomonas sp.]|uniref:OsmC family protein n=1 Tax=Pseudomonas sp. TaxID=306 RepID=UPI003D137064
MSEHLKSLFLSSQRFFTDNPGKAQATFSVASSGDGALHRRVKIREFILDVDEPQNLGGTDQGPNPVEIALAALATCQEISYHLHAAALGIPLKEVTVTLEGKIDLRGFFAVDEQVRPGFTEIRGTVKFDSTASRDELIALKESVDHSCPVMDLFRNRTPVEILF